MTAPIQVSRGPERARIANRCTNHSAGSSAFDLRRFLAFIGLLALLGIATSSFAGMRWSARAIDPSLIGALKSDDKLLEDTLFGEQPKAFTEQLKKDGRIDRSARKVMGDLKAWSEKRVVDDGDTCVELDKAWHGIHYLLTGGVEPNGTLVSKVIMGGEDIGPDRGYGPAQLLKPEEVKAIAQLLEATTPAMLRQRFQPKEMSRIGVYPDVIWEREGEEALRFVLDYYQKLVAFYKLAAERGQAVIFAIT